MKCSITIIGERELFRKGIYRLLSSISQVPVLYETGDVKGGFEILSKHQPGILLVDPFANKWNRPDILKHVKSLSPATYIVAVTDCDSPEEIAFAVGNGIKGYSLEGASFSEFENGPFHVANGEYGVSAAPAPVLSELLSGSKSGEALTSREITIYNLVRCGETNREIADRFYISLYTVRNHASKIIRKRNLKNKCRSLRNSD